MPYALENIAYENQDNKGGIPARIYFADWSDITTFSKLISFSAITNLDSAAILDAPPAMATGKQFFILDVNNEKASVVASNVGEKGGISSKIKLKFTLDGLSARNSGFKRIANNGRFAFIVPDLDTGKYFAVGCTQDAPATLATEGEGGTGEGSAGHKGYTYTFESDSVVLPILELTAQELAILLAPAAES